MQEDLDLKISMLLDGELQSEEALEIFSRIRNESELRAKWSRYNIASCASRGNTAIFPDAGFFERVSSALESEEMSSGPLAFQKRRLLRKPSVLTALAASVMLVAVIVWSGIPSTRTAPMAGSSQQSALAAVTQTDPPIPSTPVSAVPVKTEMIRRPALPRRLNDYLITHNESAFTRGTQTMMPHARVISYSYDQ